MKAITKYRTFEATREFVHKLKLNSLREWQEWSKSGMRPENIPANPHQTYKDKGWTNWYDFLGNEKIEFLTFDEAKKYLHKLNLKSIKEWEAYSKSGERPQNIPASPHIVYKGKGWKGWKDFLGNEFLTFEEARKYVRKLNLKGIDEWHEWCKSGKRPKNIPFNLYQTYKERGWIDLADFLGNEKIEFLTFEETREFVHKLKLKGQKEWYEWCRTDNKPQNIPASPYQTYRDKGWTNWKDFLGTGNIRSKDFLLFEEAREFVSGLELGGVHKWYAYCRSGKKPAFIPSNPHSVYKGKGWKGYGDWLGTGRIAFFNREYLSYEEAKEYVQNLGLKNSAEWKEWCKSGEKPHNIPASPDNVYKGKGWKGYGDWLGNGNVRGIKSKDFLPFEETREFARNLKFKSCSEWRKWSKSGMRPENIPGSPETIYKGRGWKGWGDFLGTENVCTRNIEYMTYDEAKKYLHKLNLKSIKEWEAYSKSGERPQNIPASPHTVYKGKGWKGYGDWLGTGRPSPFNRKYVSYDLAKEMIQPLEIKSPEQWIKYYKMNRIPKTIPQNPSVIYADNGWLGWEDFLGTNIRFHLKLRY